MTNQEKKAYLQKYRAADDEINDLLREKERIMSRLTRMTTSISGMPHGGGESDKMTDGVAKVIKLESEIDRKVDALCDFRDELQAQIGKIQREDFRRVLNLRYIQGLKWDSVADIMHYDIDAKKVFMLHGQALAALKLDTERH